LGHFIKLLLKSNGSHLGWRIWVSCLIEKVDQLNIISTEVSEKKNFMRFFILKIWLI